MNKLDHNEYLGKFNGSFVKGNPRDSTEQYEVNPRLLALLHKRKFAGDDNSEDRFEHLAYFKYICGTFRLPNYIDDEVKLKLFSQTLTNTALSWNRTCPAESITTWEDLSKEFLSRFYPKSKSCEGR